MDRSQKSPLQQTNEPGGGVVIGALVRFEMAAAAHEARSLKSAPQDSVRLGRLLQKSPLQQFMEIAGGMEA